MKHLFVPYELALKLKEKGFDEPCLYTIHLENVGEVRNGHQMEWIDWNNFIPSTNPSLGKCFISAPLYQQVVDFFREKHNVSIHVATNSDHTFFPMNEILSDDGSKLAGPPYIQNYRIYYEALTKAIEGALKLI